MVSAGVFSSQNVDAAARHMPVMRQRCVDLLAPAFELAIKAGRTPVCIDATLGMGGHSEALLTACPNLKVIGIDRDLQAIDLARQRLNKFGTRFEAVHTTYDQILQVAKDPVDGILMDLGVSSWQLDEVERGFSYAADSPLDMRMDQTNPITAAHILATADAHTLCQILHKYGEEKQAKRIVAAILAHRKAGKEPLNRSSQLVELIRSALPQAAMRKGGHPAKRTFQALRIAVNEELQILQAALPRAIAKLVVGGRIVVESYQSLEDRLVKAAFAQGTTNRAPVDLPFVPDDLQPYLKPLMRGAEMADEFEISQNSRSASVRLRAVEKIRPVPASLFNPQIDNQFPQGEAHE